MMTVLLESAAARGPRRGPWAGVSLIAHTVIIAGAIVLTTQARSEARPADDAHEPIIFVPVPPRAPASAQPQATEPATAPALPQAPIPSFDIPVVPTFDPTIPYTPEALTTAQVFARPTVADSGGRTTSAGGIHTIGDVDRVVAALAGNGSPEYPRALQGAGVEGEVLVQFVVGTDGRVEPGSIAILKTSHAQFAEAVRRWLPRTRYLPAEIQGQRVRQLVQLPVGFTLRRRR